VDEVLKPPEPDAVAMGAAEGNWQGRAVTAEAKLAEMVADLRFLADGCRDVASNGASLDRHASASEAYRAVAADIAAIAGSEGEGIGRG
jgi:hypothetical protein